MKKTAGVYILFDIIYIITIFSTGAVCQQAGYHDIMQLIESGEFEQADRQIEPLSAQPELYHHLRSRYYFYKSSYTEALAELALSGINTTEKKEFFEYLTLLTEYTKDFVEIETGYFRIRTTFNDRFLAYYLSGPLAKIHETIGKEFNYFPEDKIVIEIYPYKNQFAVASTLGEETIERSGAIAISKYNRLMIHSPQLLPYGYRWIDTICHEYIHFAVNRITKTQCPLWFHEGIARYYDTYWRLNPPEFTTPGNINTLINARKENKLITFERMGQSLVYLDNQDQVSLAFTEVSLSIDYLNKTYPGKLQEILHSMASATREESFKKGIDMTIPGFETSFFRYLETLELKQSTGAVTDRIYFNKVDELNEFTGVNVRDHIRLGDRFRKNNSLEYALLQYKKALDKEPNNPVVLIRTAKIYMMLNKNSPAEELLKLCVKTNPNFVTGYENLGEYYFKNSRYSECIPVFMESMQINPFNLFTHKMLAEAYMNINNPVLSVKEMEIANILTR